MNSRFASSLVAFAVACLALLSAGCGTAPDATAENAQALACPNSCTDAVDCRLADGTCATVCNACFCTRRGGVVDKSCGLAAAPTAQAAKAAPEVVIGGGTCGGNVCGAGTYCCNASCGVCARKGDLCTDVVCEPDTAKAPSPSN